MIPVDQTIFAPHKYDPNSTVRGNCVQACLASILEVGVDNPPHCPHMDHSIFKTWLASRGLAWVKTSVMQKFGGYHLMTGVGPRTQIGLDGSDFPVHHCVVGFNGEMVHDPHPSRAGLISCDQFWWFITLNPARR